MLKRFSVINFKNFRRKTEVILDHPSSYEFNEEIIQNHCISKGIFYGINGCGKSNLALALFDIILHLTDKEKAIDRLRQKYGSGAIVRASFVDNSIGNFTSDEEENAE